MDRDVVPDGRTDRDKLDELLRASEGTRLDFKENLDLANPKDKLSLVKDLVAMSNRPGGGFILVGVDDSGKLSSQAGTLDRRSFDGANLRQVVGSFTEGEFEIHSQVHEVDDKEVILIAVEGHRDGLPVPMSKIGQYDKPQSSGKPRSTVVFREGEVLLREGSENVTLKHHHWAGLLQARDQLIREQAQEAANQLMAVFVSQMQTSPQTAPLSIDMPLEAFASSVASNLESGTRHRLDQVLLTAENYAKSAATPTESVIGALDRITVIAAQSILHGEAADGTFKRSLSSLVTTYGQASEAGYAGANLFLEILKRVYALGSLAVRMRRWTLVRQLVMVPVADGERPWPSWLRHGQIAASHTGLFDEAGALLISASRALVAAHPEMRPDLPDDLAPVVAVVNERDALMDSLCQFDALYCMLVAANPVRQSAYYPSFSGLSPRRIDPVLIAIATQPDVREDLFPGVGTEQVRGAMGAVLTFANSERGLSGNFWSEPSEEVRDFLRGD
jgi:hypothetical protein